MIGKSRIRLGGAVLHKPIPQKPVLPPRTRRNSAEGTDLRTSGGAKKINSGTSRSDELSLSGELYRVFSGSRPTPNSLNVTSLDSRWAEQFILSDRVHFLPSFFIEGELVATPGSSRTYRFTNSGTEFDTYPFNLSPELGLGLRAHTQTLLTLFVQYRGYTSHFSINGGAATDSGYDSTTFGFHVLIEF